MIFGNLTPITFTIEDPIDFSVSSSDSPTTVTIAQVTSGNPSQFLLKKTAKGFSGAIATTSEQIGTPQEFLTINIKANDIAGIVDIFDSDGNQYYEVDYLGQDLVFDGIKNTNINDPDNYTAGNDTPYILKTKQVQNRFTSSDNQFKIRPVYVNPDFVVCLREDIHTLKL